MPDIRRGDVPIHYELARWTRRADGAVPLLLHTGAGGDLRMWSQAGYTEGLSPDPLVLIDHRGHGRSGRPTALAEHSMDAYVADVAAVLDDAGATRVVFVGYSDGVAVAIAFAAAHPARTAAIVGLGSTLGGQTGLQAGRPAMAAEFRRAGIDSIMTALDAQEREPVPDWFAAQMRDTDPAMFALELEGWADWEGPWTAEIEAPTLLLVGELEDEPGVVATELAVATARLRRGRSVVVPDLGHAGIFVRADLTLPFIRAFVDEAV